MFIPAIGWKTAPDVIASFANNNQSGTNTSSYSLSISNMLTTGHRIIGVVGRKASPSATINSVTVDGQSATGLGTQVDNSGSSCRFFIAPATGNTTANVEVGWSTTVLRCGIGVWNVLNLQSTTAADAQGSITPSGNALSATVSTPNGGAVFGIVYNSNSRTFTWTNADLDFNALIEDGDHGYSGGFRNYATGGNITVTATANGTLGNQVFAALAMR